MATTLDIPEGFVLESELDVPEGFVIEPQPDELGIGQEVRGVGRALKRGYHRAIQSAHALSADIGERTGSMEQVEAELQEAKDEQLALESSITDEPSLTDRVKQFKAQSKVAEKQGQLNALRAIPVRIAGQEKKIQAIPTSPDLATLDTDFWGTFARNPVETIATVAAESLPQSIAGTVAGAAIAGPPGMVAGTAANSLGAEYANTILNEARKSGVDMTDPEQVSGFFSDKEKMRKARTEGLQRGIPIAAFDAATFGVAGKFLKPVLGQGAKKVIPALGKEVTVQSLGGGGGETAAQFISEGKITSLPDIVLEATAGILPEAISAAPINILGKQTQLSEIKQTADTLRATGSPLTAQVVEGQALQDLADQVAEELAIATTGLTQRGDVGELGNAQEESNVVQTGIPKDTGIASEPKQNTSETPFIGPTEKERRGETQTPINNAPQGIGESLQEQQRLLVSNDDERTKIRASATHGAETRAETSEAGARSSYKRKQSGQPVSEPDVGISVGALSLSSNLAENEGKSDPGSASPSGDLVSEISKMPSLPANAPQTRREGVVPEVLETFDKTVQNVPSSDTIRSESVAVGERAISAIESLEKKIGEGTYSDPLLLTPLAKLALKIAKQLIRGGMALERAIREAIAQARAQTPDAKDDDAKLGEAMRGALESERRLSEPGTTGIKNAVTDQKRSELGLPPAFQPLRETHQAVWDEAMARIESDPQLQQRLIDELQRTPRNINQVEEAILMHANVVEETNLASTQDAINKAQEANDVSEVQRQKDLEQATLNRLQTLYDIDKAVGTIWGRAGSFRRRMINADFSLVAMERRFRAEVNDGEPLSDDQLEEVKKAHTRIKELEKKLTEIEQKAADAEARRILELERLAAQKPSDRVIEIAEKIVNTLNKRADAARERLKGKVFTLSPDVLADLAEIGASHIATIGLDFAKWSKVMVDDLGERVRPHLETIWKAAQGQIDRIASSVTGKLSDKPDAEPVKRRVKKQPASGDALTDLKSKASKAATDGERLDQKLVYDLARYHINAGVKDFDAVFDAVLKDLQEFFPELTKREVLDAFSDYGKTKHPSKEEDKVKLREYRRLAQLVSAIEDVRKKEPPKRTGLQRDPPTQVIRDKMKELVQAMRVAGITTTSPEQQLKTALDGVKTRLRNQIEDLERQLKTGEKTPKKKGIAYDKEAADLRSRRDALREQLQAIEGKPEMTEEQRNKIALQAAQKSLEEYQRRIKELDFSRRGKPARAVSVEVQAARAERDAAKELYETLRDNSDEAKVERIAKEREALERQIAEKEAAIARGDVAAKPSTQQGAPELAGLRQRRDALNKQIAQMRRGPLKTPQERALERYKKTIKRKTQVLQEKLARGDYAPPVKNVTELDGEALKARYEYEQAKAEFNRKVVEDLMAKRSIPAKILGGAREAVNTMRAILTSFDLSAVLRQGGFITLGHPVRALRSFPAMLKAFASKEAEFAVMEEIKNRPNAPQYSRAGLFLAEEGSDLVKMEEAFMSRWIDRIPKAIGGGFVRGSQRAYVTFLNKLRADSFDAMAQAFSERNNTALTPNQYKAIANFINVATGRGVGLSKGAAALNTVFFAPRLVSSRFELLLGQPFLTKSIKGDWAMRRMIAKEYARFLVGAAVVYALGMAAGGDVEDDPRSSDFGKLRFGNERLDPLAGLLQISVLLSRLASGETKSIKSGKITPIRGDKVPFGGSTAVSTITHFLRSKLSPAASTIVDLNQGKDILHQEVTPASLLYRNLVPISFQDIGQVMENQGVAKGTVMEMLQLLGFGLQSHEERTKANR